MTSRSKYGYQPVLSLVFALSLYACGPAPVSQGNPPASPLPTSPPSPSVMPSANAALADLTLRLQADASLSGFATTQQSPLTLCLGQIAQASTRVSFAASLPAAAQTALEASGATLRSENGRSVVTLSRNLSLRTLLTGLDIPLNGVPAGTFEGRTTFFNDVREELGFVSWQAEVAGGASTVTVTLKATNETLAADSCPRLGVEVSGGSILGAGGRVVNPNPLPNPVTTPSPGPSPTASPSVAANAPALPVGLQVVEQTSSSLTLQWEFGSGPLSYNLYRDGQLVQSNYVSPNYFRFEGLSPNTTYRLGVQAFNSGGSSPIASLSSTTLSTGHSGSGNFSGGGSSGRRTPSPSAGELEPVFPGQEFHVNQYTGETQYTPVVALNESGDFVVVWTSFYHDLNADVVGVYARVYDEGGNPVTSEFHVNAYTAGDQANSEVAMDADGNFVIVFNSRYQDGDSDGVILKRYDSLGNQIGGETVVNDATNGNQTAPDIGMDDDGNFVVTWMDESAGNYDLKAQLFDAEGIEVGSEFLVNTYTTSAQLSPRVAMTGDGDFVITWQSQDQEGDNSGGVFAQRFDTEGNKLDSEFHVNIESSNGQENPDVAIDDQGDFVIAWMDYGLDGDYGGIYARRYDSRGNDLSSQFQVNEYTTGRQELPRMAMDADGDFVITWTSKYEDGNNTGVVARQYGRDGQPLGSEFVVNSYTTNSQRNFGIAMDSDGEFIVTFYSRNQYDQDDGVFAKRYLHE